MVSLPLPSFSDIMIVFVLIVPGFISFGLFKRIALNEDKVSDFEATIWSLSISLAIYVLFGYLTNLQTFEQIYFNVLNPVYVGIIFGLSLIVGCIPGTIIRLGFKRGIDYGDCWETCLKSARNGAFVLVNTVDGKEYKGAYYLGGIGKASREIIIKKPKIILRDTKYLVTDEIEMGTSIIFKKEDIARIVFLNELDF